VITLRPTSSAFFIFVALIGTAVANDSNLKSDEVYSAWLQMYDLKFDEAHRQLALWQEAHPDDSLGPASDAAAYLFSELTRLGSLESALFVDDNRFKNRKTLDPDPKVKTSFNERMDQADRLADTALQKSNVDSRALFVKTLTYGLRADYVALIDGHGVKALSYTKAGRIYAERLLAADPQASDAYLGPGVENYLLSLKPIALRVLLRLTGSQVDREAGLEKLQKTALQGYYLEPFAKLLLAVAALRDGHPEKAREILAELHQRFPDNELYTLELSRLATTTQ
jgi:Tetratricopeptide repeat